MTKHNKTRAHTHNSNINRSIRKIFIHTHTHAYQRKNLYSYSHKFNSFLTYYGVVHLQCVDKKYIFLQKEMRWNSNVWLLNIQKHDRLSFFRIKSRS